ncbi:hypothetical protein [Streptomyces bohaiensis]|uniref:hypothetical protein n=1 Tax=Streptomyces bohaiensis TaxID=1431344 RepID=UPI003B778BEA
MAMSPPASGPPDHGIPPGSAALPADDELLACGRSVELLWESWDDGTVAEDPHVAGCPHCAAALDGLRVLDDFAREAEAAEHGAIGRLRAGPGADRYEPAVHRTAGHGAARDAHGPGVPGPGEDALPGAVGTFDAAPAAPGGAAPPRAGSGSGSGTGTGSGRGSAGQAGPAEPDTDAAADADAAFAARVMDLVRLELRPGRNLPLGGLTEDHWVGETTVTKTFRAAAETLPGVRAGSCRITPDDPAASTGLLGRGAPRGPVRVRMEVAAPLTWTVPELAAAVRDRVLSVAEEALGMPVAAVDVRVTDMYEPEAPPPARGGGASGPAPAGGPGDDPTEGP